MEKKTIQAYLDVLQTEALLVSHSCDAIMDQAVAQLTYDSRLVTESTLFVCKGAAFQVSYLEAAAAQGAIAYVSETAYRTELPCILVTDIRRAMAVLADVFYHSPYQEIPVIGITGTKGKSSTVAMLTAMINEHSRRTGKPRCGVISSIGIYDGVEEAEAKLTTPEAIELYRHLRRAADAKLPCAVVEVSSQALKYHRVGGIEFQAAAVLNLSRDHISPVEHPDMEDYIRAKAQILRQTKVGFVNMDTAHLDGLSEALEQVPAWIGYGICKKAPYEVKHLSRTDDGYTFSVTGGEWEAAFRLPLPGIFNVENALAAIVIAHSFGVSDEAMQAGLADISIPGRSEIMKNADESRVAVIDYAHNGLSFENVLSMARLLYPQHRMVCVFGSTGDKAQSRRADMAAVVSRLADVVYLTMDDPGHERVEDIIDEIASYIDSPRLIVHKEADRRRAIERAMTEQLGNVCFLLLGKGRETSQKIGGKAVAYESDPVLAQQWL